jgi:carbonic anhydrase
LQPIKNTLDLNKLLPDERSYYHLQGSLTTPPCSENILWFVMKNPIDISTSQLMTVSEPLPSFRRP